MPANSGNDPVLAQLRPLLSRQLGKLRRRYMIYGLAKSLLWTAALVTLFFVLDRWLLDLPTEIRLLHSAATVGACAYDGSWLTWTRSTRRCPTKRRAIRGGAVPAPPRPPRL